MFKESIQKNYKISFDDWYNGGMMATVKKYQVNIGSAHSVNFPKRQFCGTQTADGLIAPNKIENIAIFDNLNVRRCICEIDGYRCPRDSVLTNSGLIDYTDQYRDLKKFYTEYVAEELMNPFISYPDMKSKYPFQVIQLRFQVDHITAKKFLYWKNIEMNLRTIQTRLDFLL